jgi:hypothetical protein
MNRNRTKAIELLFDIIKIKFDLSSQSLLPNDFFSARWIRGKQIEEDWLTFTLFKETIEISHEIRFALIEYDSKLFLIATGLEDPDRLPTGITYYPINSGLFTAIVIELELPVKSSVTNLYLEENILSQNNSDPLYKGHEMVDLLSIYPNIFVGEITAQFIGDNSNIHQIACSYLANNKKFITLPYSEYTLDKLNELVLLNSKILSYDSIFQSLLSSQFKFSFLDLYRCLEMLYQIIYIDDTYRKLALTIDKTDFLVAIDDKLNWRPNERNALKKLFAETPEQYRKEVESAIKKISNKKNEFSDWLYDLRCSIVHLKSTHKNFELKPQEWDKLILGIGHLTTYWYQKYQTFS